jgi:hypothetical protein
MMIKKYQNKTHKGTKLLLLLLLRADIYPSGAETSTLQSYNTPWEER